MIASFVASTLVAAPAFATSLNFDDLSEGESVPAGYGGASWEGGRITSSGAGLAVYGLSIEASFATPIVFEGADMSFSGLRRDRGFKLFYQGNEVYSFTYQYQTDNGLFLPSNHSGAVDRVVIFDDYEGVAVDNFKFATAPVPEPESYAMLLAGLGIVAAMARRRSR